MQIFTEKNEMIKYNVVIGATLSAKGLEMQRYKRKE